MDGGITEGGRGLGKFRTVSLNRSGIVFATLCLIFSGTALAIDDLECKQLAGKGAGETSSFLSYRVELKIFECAGMMQDIAELDAMDRDIMLLRTKNYPLQKLRDQVTDTTPPRKYSEVTSVSRLARFKQLVDAYYRPLPFK